ncbi:MAG: carbohydrate ABC transporter permease [Chloroflexi bacterium]|nr:carbohydrate ABC transporter permease [Chloroflexota bacterium]
MNIESGPQTWTRAFRKLQPTPRLGKHAMERLNQAVATTIVAIGAVAVLFPVVWMLSTSLKPSGDVFLIPPRWIPRPIMWSNYPEALRFMKANVVFANSTTVAVLSVIGVSLSSAITAYPFARLRARGSNLLFFLVISVMMLPAQVTLIPQFLLFKSIGWIDTLRPLFVPRFFGAPYFIFLLRQFFRTIHKDLDDAAIIDGCSHFGIFWRIILPLSKPALGVVAIQEFIWRWNEFLHPLIYLNSTDKFTVALALQNFQVAYGGTPWHLLMAASLVALLPTILVFFIGQRFFIQGVVITGVKG